MLATDHRIDHNWILFLRRKTALLALLVIVHIQKHAIFCILTTKFFPCIRPLPPSRELSYLRVTFKKLIRNLRPYKLSTASTVGYAFLTGMVNRQDATQQTVFEPSQTQSKTKINKPRF